jgi:hypothetical protein
MYLSAISATCPVLLATLILTYSTSVSEQGVAWKAWFTYLSAINTIWFTYVFPLPACMQDGEGGNRHATRCVASTHPPVALRRGRGKLPPLARSPARARAQGGRDNDTQLVVWFWFTYLSAISAICSVLLAALIFTYSTPVSRGKEKKKRLRPQEPRAWVEETVLCAAEAAPTPLP